MKKLLKILFSLFISIILLFAFALPLNPAGNWYQQFMPNIGPSPITDIFFVDSLTGYAVTNYQASNDTDYILKTTNSGDSWTIIRTDMQEFAGFNRVYFLDANTGFTAGVSHMPAYSAISKTTDGGNSWSNVNPPTDPFTARDISILSPDTMWVVSDNSLTGGVFRTTNGGASWEPKGSFSSNPAYIYMYNSRIGYIAPSTNSGTPYTRRTTDGGASWSIIVNGEGFRDIYFVDSLKGWRAWGNNMYMSTNGGIDWQTQILPSGGNIVNTAVFEFSNINRDTIWGVGGAINTSLGIRGIIYRTVNGGTNWLFQLPDTTIPIPAYYHCKFINKLNGWAYTTVPTGIHTSVGGDPVWYTGIQQVSNAVPQKFKLKQNYPNPFNPRTVIPYSLSSTAHVKIIAYDMQGREVQTMVDKYQQAGEYEVDFMGKFTATGVYFYSLIIEGVVIDTKKMILLK